MLVLLPPLRLRAIAAGDQAFIDALYRSTRDDLAAMEIEESFLAQLIRLQQEAQAQGVRRTFPQAQYFLLERDGEPVGRLVIEATAERVHLVDLALAPAFRNLGAGSAVLRALQSLAEQRGQPATLSVTLANSAARRLYGRLGFVVTDSDPLQERMRWQLFPVRHHKPVPNTPGMPLQLP